MPVSFPRSGQEKALSPGWQTAGGRPEPWGPLAFPARWHQPQHPQLQSGEGLMVRSFAERLQGSWRAHLGTGFLEHMCWTRVPVMSLSLHIVSPSLPHQAKPSREGMVTGAEAGAGGGGGGSEGRGRQRQAGLPPPASSPGHLNSPEDLVLPRGHLKAGAGSRSWPCGSKGGGSRLWVRSVLWLHRAGHVERLSRPHTRPGCAQGL